MTDPIVLVIVLVPLLFYGWALATLVVGIILYPEEMWADFSRNLWPGGRPTDQHESELGGILD